MGSLISPIPRAGLLFPVPQPQECGQTGFVLSPLNATLLLQAWVWHLQDQSSSRSLQLHQAGLSGEL